MARIPDLSHLPLADIRAELVRRKRAVDALLRKRARVAKKLAAVDARLYALHGSTIRRLSRNDANLVETITQVLGGKSMRVPAITNAVVLSGYATKAKRPAAVVSNALLNNPKRFRRVARGRYAVA